MRAPPRGLAAQLSTSCAAATRRLPPLYQAFRRGTASGTLGSNAQGFPRDSRANPRSHDLARRSAVSPGEPDSKRLSDPLPKHVPGAIVVATQPARYDGGTDLCFYESLS